VRVNQSPGRRFIGRMEDAVVRVKALPDGVAANGAAAPSSLRLKLVGQARYVEVDLRAPGLEVWAALEKAQEIVNRAGGSGWSYGHRPSDFGMVIYREFETRRPFEKHSLQFGRALGAESSRAKSRHLPKHGAKRHGAGSPPDSSPATTLDELPADLTTDPRFPPLTTTA
jgi:hypothetical protein